MKSFFRFFFQSLPFVLGVILTLVALSFLMVFARAGSLDFEQEEFWAFIAFAVAGIPLTLFGINVLSGDSIP